MRGRARGAKHSRRAGSSSAPLQLAQPTAHDLSRAKTTAAHAARLHHIPPGSHAGNHHLAHAHALALYMRCCTPQHAAHTWYGARCTGAGLRHDTERTHGSTGHARRGPHGHFALSAAAASAGCPSRAAARCLEQALLATPPLPSEISRRAHEARTRTYDTRILDNAARARARRNQSLLLQTAAAAFLACAFSCSCAAPRTRRARSTITFYTAFAFGVFDLLFWPPWRISPFSPPPYRTLQYLRTGTAFFALPSRNLAHAQPRGRPHPALPGASPLLKRRYGGGGRGGRAGGREVGADSSRRSAAAIHSSVRLAVVATDGAAAAWRRRRRPRGSGARGAILLARGGTACHCNFAAYAAHTNRYAIYQQRFYRRLLAVLPPPAVACAYT